MAELPPRPSPQPSQEQELERLRRRVQKAEASHRKAVDETQAERASNRERIIALERRIGELTQQTRAIETQARLLENSAERHLRQQEAKNNRLTQQIRDSAPRNAWGAATEGHIHRRTLMVDDEENPNSANVDGTGYLAEEGTQYWATGTDTLWANIDSWRTWIPIGGANGGGPWPWDFLVNDGYTGTAGLAITVFGHTYYVYATVQAAITAGIALSRTFSIFVQHGTYNETITIPDFSHEVHINGAGIDSTIIGQGVATNSIAIGTTEVFFRNMTLRTGTGGALMAAAAGGSGDNIKVNCEGVAFSGGAMAGHHAGSRFENCTFRSGWTAQANETVQNCTFVDCTTDAAFDFQTNTNNFTKNIMLGISLSGTDAELKFYRVTDCFINIKGWQSGAGQRAVSVSNGIRTSVLEGHFPPPAPAPSTEVATIALTLASGFQSDGVQIRGSFAAATGLGATNRYILVDGTGVMRGWHIDVACARNSTPAWLEDMGGISIEVTCEADGNKITLVPNDVATVLLSHASNADNVVDAGVIHGSTIGVEPPSSSGHNILSTTHSDSVGAVSPAAGALVVANSTPAWDTSIQAATQLTYSTGVLGLVFESGSARWDMTSYGDSPVSTIRMQRLRGTIASPTAVQAGDILGIVTSLGLGTAMRNGPQFRFVASETFAGATAHGNRMEFYTTLIGDTNDTLRLTLPDYGGLLIPQITAPSAGVSNNAIVYVKDVSGTTRLCYKDDASVEHILYGAAALYSEVQYIFTPDAGPGAVVTAGDQQGNIYHSGTNGFIATKLYVDAETAPGASGLPITVQYGDTDDLDTVASWTTIATVTASTNDNTVSTTSMTNATVPADRLVRMNVGTIVGSPTDVTVTLTAKKQLQT